MSIKEFTNVNKVGLNIRNLVNRRIIGDIIRLTFADGYIWECKLTDWNKKGFEAPIIIGYKG